MFFATKLAHLYLSLRHISRPSSYILYLGSTVNLLFNLIVELLKEVLDLIVLTSHYLLVVNLFTNIFALQSSIHVLKHLNSGLIPLNFSNILTSLPEESFQIVLDRSGEHVYPYLREDFLVNALKVDVDQVWG
jgi:hypothetical protein